MKGNDVPVFETVATPDFVKENVYFLFIFGEAKMLLTLFNLSTYSPV